MSNVIRVLQFLRVADEQGNLSLTNLALTITLGRMLMQPELNLPDLATFLVTVAGYQFKRYMAPDPQAPSNEVDDLKKAIETLQSKVSALHLGKSLGK